MKEAERSRRHTISYRNLSSASGKSFSADSDWRMASVERWQLSERNSNSHGKEYGKYKNKHF